MVWSSRLSPRSGSTALKKFAPLLNLLSRLIDFILVQDQVCRLSFIVLDESNLDIYFCEEKVRRPLHRHFGLACHS